MNDHARLLFTSEGYNETTILDHPQWQKHWRLERDMMLIGKDRHAKAVGEARDAGEMTRVRPYRRLLEQLLGAVTRGIADWTTTKETFFKTKGGRLHVAYPFLRDGDQEAYALIALRTVIDGLAVGWGTNLMGLAAAIGLSCEYQARARAWIAAKPELWHEVQLGLKRQKSTEAHRQRVNINRFNKLVAEDIGWVEWTHEERLRVGLTLIDILVSYTKRFTIEPDPSPPKSRRVTKKPMVLVAGEDVVEWLIKAIERDELMHPAYMPMLVPPKRWTTLRDGGYWTPMVFGRSLIRFKAQHEEQRNRALDDLGDALGDHGMPDVYRAVNLIQEVPWKINGRVLDVAREVWEKDLVIAGMPQKEKAPLPPRPADIDTNEEALKLWKRDAAQIYGANARRLGHALAVKRCITVAERFDGETFYFPHVLDFRGRMYPIPATLNPQGTDLARGLLTFADGKHVDDAAMHWLKIHLANCWGIDKCSFSEREAWVEERWDLWTRIATDPLGNREWAQEASKPWQALAAIFEYYQAMTVEGFVSSLPVTIDGTCNGIQHLSAMLRDEVGGAAVNLIDGDRPRDIYQGVANRLADKLRVVERGGGEEGALATMWLKLASPTFPRSLCKRPVMILPYGGTIEAYNEYTRDWLSEADPEGLAVPKEKRAKHVAWLCRHMWSVVGEVVVAGMQLMKWFKQCAGIAAESGVPLYWQTPSGFIVQHFYAREQMYKVRTLIDGKPLSLVDWRKTNDMSRPDQLKGIAPNFVHSLDASSLVLSLLIASHNGVTALTAVHDAYGTIAADLEVLYASLRHGFVKTYEEWQPLEDFRIACLKATPLEKDRAMMPRVPEMRGLDIRDVLSSSYFFG